MRMRVVAKLLVVLKCISLNLALAFLPPLSTERLQGCVCVVTGSSRGIGKGIAIELGKAGATVYVTGTSSSRKIDVENDSIFVTNEEVGGKFPLVSLVPSCSPNTPLFIFQIGCMVGPGTIEETANEVTKAGGLGIPFYCDHSDDIQVQRLFETIRNDQGRLDLLVNNAFRVPKGGTTALFSNFWEASTSSSRTSPGETWDAMHQVGCRSHYVASSYAVPIMLQNEPKSMGQMNRPLIAMISSFGGLCYTFNVAYGVGKAAVDRMTKDMAFELKNVGIDCTSFYPGVVMTERMQQTVENGSWEEEVGIPLDNAESPGFTGKAIVAVSTDSAAGNVQDNDDVLDTRPSKPGKSGTFQVVAELAQEYGFTEDDGRQPPSIRSLRFLLPAYGMDKATREKIPGWMLDKIPDVKLPFFVMAQGAPPEKE